MKAYLAILTNTEGKTVRFTNEVNGIKDFINQLQRYFVGHSIESITRL